MLFRSNSERCEITWNGHDKYTLCFTLPPARDHGDNGYIETGSLDEALFHMMYVDQDAKDDAISFAQHLLAELQAYSIYHGLNIW